MIWYQKLISKSAIKYYIKS